jgi:hypothetical protein
MFYYSNNHCDSVLFSWDHHYQNNIDAGSDDRHAELMVTETKYCHDADDGPQRRQP